MEQPNSCCQKSATEIEECILHVHGEQIIHISCVILIIFIMYIVNVNFYSAFGIIVNGYGFVESIYCNFYFGTIIIIAVPTISISDFDSPTHLHKDRWENQSHMQGFFS